MKNPVPLSDAIKGFIDKYPHRRHLKRGMILSLWPEVVGQKIASQCKDLYFKGSSLYVHVPSQAWRHELHMQRFSILKKLNEEVREEIIKEIIVKS